MNKHMTSNYNNYINLNKNVFKQNMNVNANLKNNKNTMVRKSFFLIKKVAMTVASGITNFMFTWAILSSISTKIKIVEKALQCISDFGVDILIWDFFTPNKYTKEVWTSLFALLYENHVIPFLSFNDKFSKLIGTIIWLLISPILFYIYKTRIIQRIHGFIVAFFVIHTYKTLNKVSNYLNKLKIVIYINEKLARAKQNFIAVIQIIYAIYMGVYNYSRVFRMLNYLMLIPLTIILYYSIPTFFVLLGLATPFIFYIGLFRYIYLNIDNNLCNYVNYQGYPDLRGTKAHWIVSLLSFYPIVKNLTYNWNEFIFTMVPTGIFDLSKYIYVVTCKLDYKLKIISEEQLRNLLKDLLKEDSDLAEAIDTLTALSKSKTAPLSSIAKTLDPNIQEPTFDFPRGLRLQNLEFEKSSLVKWYLEPTLAAAAKIVNTQGISLFHPERKILRTFGSNRAHKVILSFIKKIAYNKDGAINERVEKAFKTLTNSIMYTPDVQYLDSVKEKYKELVKTEVYPLGLDEVVSVLGKFLGIIQSFNSRRVQNITYIKTITSFLKKAYTYYRQLVDQEESVKFGIINGIPDNYQDSLKKALKDGLISMKQFEDIIKSVQEAKRNAIVKDITLGERFSYLFKRSEIFKQKLKTQSRLIIFKEMLGIKLNNILEKIKDKFNSNKKDITPVSNKARLNIPTELKDKNLSEKNKLNKQVFTEGKPISINKQAFVDKELNDLINVNKPKAANIERIELNLLREEIETKRDSVKMEEMEVARQKMEVAKQKAELLERQAKFLAKIKNEDIEIESIYPSETINAKVGEGRIVGTGARVPRIQPVKAFKLDSSDKRYIIKPDKTTNQFKLIEHSPVVGDPNKTYVPTYSTTIKPGKSFKIKDK